MIVVVFSAYALADGLTPIQIGYHLLSGFAALVLGFAFFAFRFVGGGDAKLFAAVALWFGYPDVLFYALAVSVAGGGLALIVLWFRRLALPEPFRQDWILRLHDERSGIPYGVALAVGGGVIIPYTDMLRGLTG